jgi:hypothetical protein
VNGSPAKGRSTIALILGSLLAAGCAGSGQTAPTTAAPAPTGTQTPTSAPAATPTSPAPPMPAPTPTPATVTAKFDVSFESANPLNPPGILNLFAPVRPGRWPVVVMFHGNPAAVSREYLSVYARRVAEEGFVVFVPTWGKSGGAAYDALSFVDQANADAAQAACAVAFARARAADYGGDPARMIAFGHSGGGNIASVVAFARPAPTEGCRGGTKLGAIDALIAWEGDWVLAPPFWDSVLADEPAVLDALTPWKHLADRRDLPVYFTVSDKPGLGREDGAWLEVRDPSGTFRRLFEAIGALDDGYMGVDELQAMFARALEAQGNPVTYEVMPDSTHESISPEGWKVFVAAFRKAAG